MTSRGLSLVSAQIRRSAQSAAASSDSDGSLLSAFIDERNSDAFAALVRRFGPMVLGVCQRLTRDNHLADDAFQATFLVLARRAADIRPREAVRAWLYGVAVRSAREAFAMSTRLRAREASMPRVPDRPAPFADQIDPDAVRAIDEEIAQLPDLLRSAVVLCELDGLSRRDAAERLGIAEGTLSSRLAKARKILAAKLRRRGFGAPSVGITALLGVVARGARVRAALQNAAIEVAESCAIPSAAAEIVRGANKSMLLKKLTAVFVASAVAIAACVTAASTTRVDAAGDDKSQPSIPEQKQIAEVDPSKATIEGVVVDEAGKPVSGAVIARGRYDCDEPAKAVRSDSEGRFRLVLDNSFADYTSLIASADGGSRQGFLHIGAFGTERVEHSRIVLKAACTMRVHVVDSNKDPVVGASVGMTCLFDLVSIEQTDQSRIAILRYPADIAIEQVIALKGGVGFDYFEQSTPWNRGITRQPPETVELNLNGFRKVQVRAVDSSGKPLPNIKLMAWTITKRKRLYECNLCNSGMLDGVISTTDKNGVATFDWIPLDLTEDITFLCRSPGWYQPDKPHFTPSQPNAPLTAQLFRLVPISGKVSLPDGKPASGILIQAEGRGTCSNYYRGKARTQADGTWNLEVYPGQTYVVAITNNDWAAPSQTGLLIKEGETRKGLDFRLGKGTLVIGKATVGKENKPAADQTVTFLENNTLVRWSKTDKDGNYQIRLGDGGYEIRFDLQRTGLLVKGTPTIERNFHLERLPRGELRGIVRTSNGSIAPNAIVRGDSIGVPNHGSLIGHADATGNYRVNRWHDRMSLYASDETGTQATLIRIDADTETADLKLASAGTAYGTLFGSNGLPIEGARLYCQICVGEGEDRKQVAIETSTDGVGKFRLAGLIDGSECRVTIYALELAHQLPVFRPKADEGINLGRIELVGK
jgi:RNA polymerase sigma factor (sigma-70 family)